MAQYRQSGFDRAAAGLRTHDYANGGAATTNGGEHLAIGVRSAAHKQPRHRRLGHNKSGGRRISISTVISFLCFVLAVSAFLFLFLSRDHSDAAGKRKFDDSDRVDADINKRDAQDYDFSNDFLANVTRITAAQVKFGNGAVAYGRDSRYWDGDDRRRDEDYNEDAVSKSSSSSERQSDKDHVPSRGNSPAKKSDDNANKHADHHGLYNEAGRNELKIYEEKYEASLKNVGQSGLGTGEGSHESDDSNPDMENEETENDAEYENESGSRNTHVDDYEGNGRENEVNSDLHTSHSKGTGENVVKARDTLETLDKGSSKGGSSKLSSSDNNRRKHRPITVAEPQSKSTSEKRSKKHGRHHCKLFVYFSPSAWRLIGVHW
ncbi:hypothetical protein Cgig2_029541 [Carnegiea gigantea]|uniref:Uncharacterized protein n=1 Tax=Carnegiea gigantea TaxID=171969 RepID=A0A9Q1QKK8_9CARY|nr:hypothetical protein Cgig2_029541 [Carnegiea gigantea]